MPVHPDKLNQVFKGATNKPMYSYQYKLTELMYEDPDAQVIINKSRQTGISFWGAGWALTSAISGHRTLLSSPSLRQSMHLRSYADYWKQGLLRKVPKLKDAIEKDTATEIRFDSGGYLLCLPNSANTIRGYPADTLFFDEWAHFLHGTDDEIETAVTPSLSRGGQIIKNSTPFGEGNNYYNTWDEAGKKGYTQVLINWKECPDITEKVIARIKKSMDEYSFQQEYENVFLPGISTYFPLSLLRSRIDTELANSPETDAELTYCFLDVGREIDLMALVMVTQKFGHYTVKFTKYWRDAPFNQIEDYAEAFIKQFEPTVFAVDALGNGAQICENLQYKANTDPRFACVYRFIQDRDNKIAMYQDLKNLMTAKTPKITLVDDPQLILSLNSIERKQVGDGIKFEAKRGELTGHGDMATACAGAVYVSHKRKISPFIA